MGLFFRKSIRIGKHTRLNINKDGIGVSTGIKGLHVGANSKGTYVSGGKNGVYYRKQLSSNKNNKILLKNTMDIKDIKKYNFKVTGKAVNSLIKKCFIFAIISFVLMALFAPLGFILLGIDMIILIGTFISLEKRCWKCNKENKYVDEGL